MPIQIWLFGYELNDTICVFTRDGVHILSGKKEIEFLKPLENRIEMDENELVVKLLSCDQVLWNSLIEFFFYS